jgi:glucokinase
MTTLLGIDIGGTKIAGGLVNAETGAVIFQDRVPTVAAEGGPAVLERALALARKLMAEATAREIAPQGAGVGAGGQIDSRTGVVLSATAILPGWEGTRLKDAFVEGLQMANVQVDNDVNALAMGENRFGAGRGWDNLLYLALGTGVGGAIISNGRLHRSARGVSGEIGHLILDPGGLECTCGGRGCLEQYVSGPALLRHYQALNGGVGIADGTSLKALALNDPDGAAAHAILRTGEILGVGLVSLVNIFGPDRIIIGGGLAALGAALLEPARTVLMSRALPTVRDVPVITAALGADASIVGAASLALVEAAP